MSEEKQDQGVPASGPEWKCSRCGKVITGGAWLPSLDQDLCVECFDSYLQTLAEGKECRPTN